MSEPRERGAGTSVGRERCAQCGDRIPWHDVCRRCTPTPGLAEITLWAGTVAMVGFTWMGPGASAIAWLAVTAAAVPVLGAARVALRWARTWRGQRAQARRAAAHEVRAISALRDGVESRIEGTLTPAGPRVRIADETGEAFLDASDAIFREVAADGRPGAALTSCPGGVRVRVVASFEAAAEDDEATGGDAYRTSVARRRVSRGDAAPLVLVVRDVR